MSTNATIAKRDFVGAEIGGPPAPPCFRKKLARTRTSKNSPSFAAALNWGIGSSSLKADVNAFDRLQIVRDWKSSYFGSK
jgi:hypothetical protein